MRAYWAIIVDSYREVKDSKILLIVFILSTVAILGVGGIGWWKSGELSIELGARGDQPWLGLTVREKPYGLLLSRVDQAGPFAKAKLSPGTMIASFDGYPVHSKDDLRTLLRGCKPGQEVTLSYYEPTLSFFGLSGGKVFQFVQMIDTESKLNFVQATLSQWVVGFIGVLLALVVTAGFMPRFLEPGAIHLVMARPVSRFGVIWARYLGGLSFIVLLSIYLLGGAWAVLSLRSGIWNPRTLWSIPLLIFAFAQMYAFSVLCSTVTRSTIFTVIASIAFCFFTWTLNSIYWISDGALQQMAVEGLAIDSDGKLASIVQEEPFLPFRIRQLTLEEGKEVGSYGEVKIRGLTWFQPSENGQTFFVVQRPGLIVELDHANREAVSSLQMEDSGRTQRFSVAPDGRSVLVKSQRDLAVWMFGSNERLSWPRPFDLGGERGLDAASRPRIRSLCHGGARVALGLSTGDILICGLDGKLLLRIKGAHSKSVDALQGVGGSLVSAGADGLLRVWSWNGRGKGKSLKQLEGADRLDELDLGSPPTALAGSVRQSRLAVSTDNGLTRVISVDEKGRLGGAQRLTGLGGPAVSLNFGGNARWLIGSSGVGLIQVWDAPAGSRKGHIDLAPNWRRVRQVLGLLRWLVPRSKSLDIMAKGLLAGKDSVSIDQSFGGRSRALEVRYLAPILSGLLFIIAGVSMTAGVFIGRDL